MDNVFKYGETEMIQTVMKECQNFQKDIFFQDPNYDYLLDVLL